MVKSARDIQLIELKDTILSLQKTIDSLNVTNSSLNETIQSLQNSLAAEKENSAHLKEQVDYLTQKLFGRSSEKKAIPYPGQLSLFDEAETTADPSVEEPAKADEKTIHVKGHDRKAKQKLNDKLEGLPVEKRVSELPESDRFCPDCNSPLVAIGQNFVRREIEIIPAKIQVIEYYDTVYKCEACEENPDVSSTPFVKARPQESLFPHSLASESAVAYVDYQKYVMGSPLYRLEKDWLIQGLQISRATMANWVIMAADIYFRPLYEYFHRLLLEREFLMGDETRFQVLKEPGREPTSLSYIWVFRSGEDGESPIIIYYYSPSRARAVAVSFLDGFEGYFMCDGYSGYNDLPGAKRCACFAHIRRDFLDAVPKSKRNDMSLPSVQGVAYCDKLFALEKKAREKNLSFDELKEYRIKYEEPIIDAFIEWVKAQVVTKGSKLYKAVTYATERIPYMKTYLEDGRCSLSNNLTENTVRPVVTGRKNWLFADTVKGAEASVITYTIVEMAKANGLNPYKYLVHILKKRPSNTWTDDQLAELAPWNQEVQSLCKI